MADNSQRIFYRHRNLAKCQGQSCHAQQQNDKSQQRGALVLNQREPPQ